MERFVRTYHWKGKTVRTKMVRFVCQECGKIVEREASKHRRNSIGMFCTKKCRDSHGPVNGWWEDAYADMVRELRLREQKPAQPQNFTIHADPKEIRAVQVAQGKDKNAKRHSYHPW